VVHELESESTADPGMANRIRPKLVLPAFVGQRTKMDDWSYGPNTQQASGFIRHAYFNGLGRHVCQLQRLTLKFSKTSGSCSGLRDFVEHDLINFARTNPGIAVYLKPRRKPTPILVADYLNGTSHWCNLRLFTHQQVKQWVHYYVNRSGDQIKRYRKMIHTDHPSVQGHWTPFLYLPGELNVTEFPNADRGAFVPEVLSASEQLLRQQRQGQLSNVHILEEHADDETSDAK
jgi:large subunit ribosomal protein L43